MSRSTVCALVIALQKFSPVTVPKLAKECITDPSNVREWLYEFESVGIVKRVGTTTAKGKSSGRSTILWKWIPQNETNASV